jgi:hypothetical protein
MTKLLQPDLTSDTLLLKLWWPQKIKTHGSESNKNSSLPSKTALYNPDLTNGQEMDTLKDKANTIVESELQMLSVEKSSKTLIELSFMPG